MEVFEIVGGARLVGEVRVTGAKNSVLKLMAAALLATGETTLREVPDILDVTYMAELLRRLGCVVDRDLAARTLSIDVPEMPSHQADYDLVRKLRASINVVRRMSHCQVVTTLEVAVSICTLTDLSDLGRQFTASMVS